LRFSRFVFSPHFSFEAAKDDSPVSVGAILVQFVGTKEGIFISKMPFVLSPLEPLFMGF
jgi:hypothetical protein